MKTIATFLLLVTAFIVVPPFLNHSDNPENQAKWHEAVDDEIRVN